jgi:type I restriction enzyme M protein
MMDASQIGKRAWSHVGVPRQAGLSCVEYVEQLTMLLFLKMADQLTEPPYNESPIVPEQFGRKALLKLDGAALEDHYSRSIEALALKPGMLGVIFKGARCDIHNPALLKQLVVNPIDKEDRLSLPVDVKGTIYEELLQCSASESTKSAGQYFTPRAVIQTMVEVMQPTPDDRICDPAAGTGGFLFTAYNHVFAKYEARLDRDQKRALRENLVEDMELSPKVARTCAMNLYLHGIGGDKVVVHSGHDSLAAAWGAEYSMILANPPFGKSQNLLFVNEEGDTERDDKTVLREDFWTSTSNKQLNFLQHMYTLLSGRGGAGQRAVRGRRRREDPPEPSGKVPGAHAAAPADWHLRFAGRQGQRAVLRHAGRPAGAVDGPAPGVRPAHQPTGTSRKSSRRLRARTSTSSWRAIGPAHSTSASRRGAKRTPTDAGVATPTKKLPSATS